MTSETNPGPASASSAMPKPISPFERYAMVFGLFLGLAVLKFGNPVILGYKFERPASVSDAWTEPWPPHWAHWILLPFALVGVCLAVTKRSRWPATRWLWILPVIWFGWQWVSAIRTVDAELTEVTLWQLGGCVACYFLGVLIIGRDRGLRFVSIGLVAAFGVCLLRAYSQKFFEFPLERQFLIEHQQTGWTNLPPDIFQRLKASDVIIRTNGVDIANPLIMEKYAKGRVHGTMFYPNGLAGATILILPLALAMVVEGTRRMRPAISRTAMVLMIFLGLGGLIWSGSKAGYLIALMLGGLCLLRLNLPKRLKWGAVLLALALGGVLFGVRFHSYFARGATSVSARFEYWRVAAKIAAEHPLMGTGPGTFQRPFEVMKAPGAEMARLAHNDYLEQYCDSGIIGGLAYTAWILLLLYVAGRSAWRADWFRFAAFLGLLGWFIQGTAEFSLYIPALAWTAFALAGALVSERKAA